ncbi:isoleucine patch superfamily enzyme, carbonic anhydrase/acetyltransferase [Desulfosporosinus orientis DSM 765]|uniref:Isoleucine patch superfamily enzyme, carbonic anhydrase/acetyltransferase n=1 Tax=Desulfosporosinus orientis (strain ATCC 19365 / DSM 765 / NCIMB 8382 / VKM B-1628 / Singapore I) TaxID=768706 RepID=G7WED2_DESOD|nr:gamma carbonic anhydrase family protein [Desulfosporosinus orientis]AET70745.1 isoleucine patch superfamily enzyme, carbonic anhydrase/acetyltransferase [Desulfosporosinus orientis DSM 765]
MADHMKKPQIADSVYFADGCKLIGDIQIGEQSSVWYNSVIRGDLSTISIGKCTNVQDLVAIHVNKNQPVTIDDYVTVGHSAILHSCTIGKGSQIGMGAIVLDGAVISEETSVAAGALVTGNKTYPPRVMLMGVPARVIRELTDKEISLMREAAERYVAKAQEAMKS